jgi:hypothetical protein
MNLQQNAYIVHVAIRLHADGIHYYPMFYIDDFWMLSGMWYYVCLTMLI